MKVFIRHLFFIVSCFLIITFSLDYIVGQGLKAIPNSKFQEWGNIIDGAINAEVVILGSSRGVVSYNSNLIEEELNMTTHNLSYNAGSYNLQIDKYNIYQKNNRLPKMIIQNIDMTHFSSSTYIPNTKNLLPHTNTSMIRDLLDKYNDDTKGVSRFGVVKYSKHNRYLLKGILSFLGIPQEVETHDNGFIYVDKQYKEDTSNLSRLKYIATNNKYGHLEKGIAETFRFCELQATNSDKVIVCWLPEYIDRYKINNDYTEKLRKRVKNWAADTENIYFIDLTHYDSIVQDNKYFYDSFHLNKVGAEMVSRKLIKEIKQID